MAKKSQRQVMICVPCLDSWDADFGSSLVLMMMHGAPPNTKMAFLNASQTILAQGRQDLADKAIDMGATHILWLDCDMMFPPDTLKRLLKHNKDIVGVNYPRRAFPPIPTAHDGDIVWTKKGSSGLQEVNHVGLGCCLIKAGVFKALERPWFGTPWLRDRDNFMGEDVYFFHKARQEGFTLWVDHDLSQEIIHSGTYHYSNALSESYLDEQKASGRYPPDV